MGYRRRRNGEKGETLAFINTLDIFPADHNKTTVEFTLPSRTVAYTTQNTLSRLARKELNSNPVVLELSKEKETYTSSSRNISSIR